MSKESNKSNRKHLLATFFQILKYLGLTWVAYIVVSYVSLPFILTLAFLDKPFWNLGLSWSTMALFLVGQIGFVFVIVVLSDIFLRKVFKIETWKRLRLLLIIVFPVISILIGLLFSFKSLSSSSDKEYFFGTVSYSELANCQGKGEIRGSIADANFPNSVRVKIMPINGDYKSTISISGSSYSWTDLPETPETYTIGLMQTHGLQSEEVIINWDPKDCGDNIITVDFFKK